jgi:heat shock protein HtpX
MISALRKIEGRGELPGATSAVMELCVDNPREGFGELFDTHPTVENRVEALVKYAGGHDCGPIALPPAQTEADQTQADNAADAPPQGGPWGAADAGQEGAAMPGEGPAPPDQSSGPWGPHGS